MSPTVPQGEGWIYEIKFDGYRITSWRLEDRVVLMSRNGIAWTHRFPRIAKALMAFPVGITLDGEIVINDSQGRSSFGLLQAWLKMGRGPEPTYSVFDLPFTEGEDLTNQPLTERKRRLKWLIPANQKIVSYSEHFDTGGSKLFESACHLGLEGIIAKRSQAPYVQGRTGTWLKCKCVKREEFVVGGFSTGKGAREDLGALLVGQYDADGTFRYCGKVGSGFDDADLDDIYKTISSKSIEENPFQANRENLPQKANWVKPSVVVEVKYAERTGTGLLRQAVYMGRREDKKVTEVQAEKSNLAGVEISHPDRILFPESDVTKAELAAYYNEVADLILPHIAERPLALVRCPEGAGETCFFQKHIAAGMPSSVGHRIEGEDDPIITVKTAKDLLTLIQFGAIEIHPWGSRLESLEQPDVMTFDLDPGPDVDWATVVQATLALKERLTDLGLSSYVKTSGGKGFHIVVFLQAGTVDWTQVKQFSKAIADDMIKLVPGHFLSQASKAKRQGKIFIDYLRNGRGATSVAPFSTRARAGAPVSVPIDWSLVSKLENAHTFTVENRKTWIKDAATVWKDCRNKPNKITNEMWEALGVKPPEAS